MLEMIILLHVITTIFMLKQLEDMVEAKNYYNFKLD